MPGQDPGSSPGQAMTLRQLLLDSAFHLASDSEEKATGPRLSPWGWVASSSFDGQEDKLSLDGTVTTATLGVDGIWKRGRRFVHPSRPARRRPVQQSDQRASLRRLHAQRPRAAVGPGGLWQRRLATAA